MKYSQEADIRMIQGDTAENILKESKKVLETNGEWELANITIGQHHLLLEEGEYSEIVFNVSILNHSNHCSAHVLMI